MTTKTILGFEAWVMRVQRCRSTVYSTVRAPLKAAAAYSKLLWQSRLSEYMKTGMTLEVAAEGKAYQYRDVPFIVIRHSQFATNSQACGFRFLQPCLRSVPSSGT